MFEISYVNITLAVLILSIILWNGPIYKILQFFSETSHAFANEYNDQYRIDHVDDEDKPNRKRDD